MALRNINPDHPDNGIAKTPTGIQGLDQITSGGLPTGRPTLVCGSAGCGKTLLAMEFLVRGAVQYNEPGVFVSFEETSPELVANVRSLGYDLADLQDKNKIVLDYVRVERSEILETGEYDLEGLFVRLGHAVESIGAKRVVLDTIEALFAGLPNHMILRAELRRLFRWLKERGLTAIVTGERGEGHLTRHGLEEYVADCVIVLDHRVNEQVSTRRLRIVKYRGSIHGTNEYPFLIGKCGFSVLPVTSIHLDHTAPKKRVSSGIPSLDAMLGGEGFYRGSSILLTGTAGTGKTTIAARFIEAACSRGERCLLILYEESASQFIRNMSSVGIDLDKWVKSDLLVIHATRPSLYGLEQHLVAMHDLIETFDPAIVAIDPVSSLAITDNSWELKPTLMRLIDHIKRRNITGIFTSLVGGDRVGEDSQVGVSSLMDTWVLLRNTEYNGERNRTLYILKSRGMRHSNQVREFVMSDNGLNLIDVYVGDDKVLTGTARLAQEGKERIARLARGQEHKRKMVDLERKRQTVQAQIAALQAELNMEEEDVKLQSELETMRLQETEDERTAMAHVRGGNHSGKGNGE